MTAKTPMRKMLLGLGILFAFIFLVKMIMFLIAHSESDHESKNTVSVSTIKVGYSPWQPHLNSVGTLHAIQGVDVTAETDGLIKKVLIKSNQDVKAGQVLIQLNADPDIAALKSLQADAKLSELVYARAKTQFDFNAISKEVLETNEYDWRTKEALADQQQSIVELKTVRAPFSGRLGISTLKVGQFINAGDPLISLQALESLYIYFYIPEQKFNKLAMGQALTLISDTYPDRTFTGKVTGINPVIDIDTRNVEVEGTIDNPDKSLLPGMYVRVNVTTGDAEQHLTIPQSAVSYNPYGNLVYVVTSEKDEEKDQEKDEKKHKEKNKEKPDALFVKQRFITLGEQRGDQISVVKGLQEGEEIVTSGQLKLKNNARIVVDNTVQPTNDAHPQVKDE